MQETGLKNHLRHVKTQRMTDTYNSQLMAGINPKKPAFVRKHEEMWGIVPRFTVDHSHDRITNMDPYSSHVPNILRHHELEKIKMRLSGHHHRELSSDKTHTHKDACGNPKTCSKTKKLHVEKIL